MSINDFTSEDIQKAQKWAYKFYNELGTKSPFFRAWFGDWRAYDISSYYIVHSSGNRYNGAGNAINSDTGKKISWGDTVKGETYIHAVKEKISVQALGDIGNIIENAILFDTDTSGKTSKSKMENTAFMHNFYSVYKQNNDVYLLKLYVEEALPNKGGDPFARAYQLKDIEKIAELPNGVLLKNEGLTEDNSTIVTNVADLYALVKTYDKDFHAGNKISPYLLNEDGTPKIFYHGTNAEFSVINTNTEYNLPLFTTTDRYSAGTFGKKTIGFYGKAENILVKNNNGKAMHTVFYNYKGSRVSANGLLKMAKADGYDAVVFRNAKDSADGTGKAADIYAFMKPETQLKSAADNIGTFDRRNPDIRYSTRVTAEEDTEYMDAYFDGDDELMQKLVDKAAQKAGYKYKAYHHTENGFTVFDLNKARKTSDIQGFYFSADPDAESEYGSVRYDTYLKMENPYIVDSRAKASAIPLDLSKENAGVIARKWLLDNGYDSVIRKAAYYGAEADEYIVLNSEQIKSAEPITYADDESGEGDPIPLSERFNEKNEDIRYSTRDSDGNELSKGQQEFFKDSKVRDENGNLLVMYNGTKTAYNGQPIDLGYVYKPLKESLLGKDIPNRIGYFFTDNLKTADEYSQTWNTESQSMETGRINEVYLNISNPLDLMDLGPHCTERQFYSFLENNGVYTGRKKFEASYYRPVWTYLDGKKQAKLKSDIRNAGFDGISLHDWGEINVTYIAFDSNQIKSVDNLNPTENEDIRYSERIQPGMSDEERYKVLKDAFVVAKADTASGTKKAYISIEKINDRAKGTIEKYVRDLYDELELKDKILSSPSIDIEFVLGKNNGLKESLSQQLKYSGNYHDFAKALINLDSILENAILVEQNTEDRYKGTSRADEFFEASYVLFGAFSDGTNIVPVKLEIKKDKGQNGNLYLVVSMEKIRTSVLEGGATSTTDDALATPVTDSIYSLQDIIKNVNPSDGRFLKNFPNQMLTQTQINAKEKAIEDDRKKSKTLLKKQTGQIPRA